MQIRWVVKIRYRMLFHSELYVDLCSRWSVSFTGCMTKVSNWVYIGFINDSGSRVVLWMLGGRVKYSEGKHTVIDYSAQKCLQCVCTAYLKCRAPDWLDQCADLAVGSCERICKPHLEGFLWLYIAYISKVFALYFLVCGQRSCKPHPWHIKAAVCVCCLCLLGIITDTSNPFSHIDENVSLYNLYCITYLYFRSRLHHAFQSVTTLLTYLVS